MIDENTSAVDALSLLEADLTNQETTYPILEPGIVDCIISEAKLEPTSKGNGQMLNLRLKTTMPWKTTTGQQKGPGFSLRAGIFLPTGSDVKPEAVSMAKTKLAQLRESAMGDKSGKFGSPSDYVGRNITVRLAVVPDSRDKSVMQNEVAAFVKRNA